MWAEFEILTVGFQLPKLAFKEANTMVDDAQDDIDSHKSFVLRRQYDCSKSRFPRATPTAYEQRARARGRKSILDLSSDVTTIENLLCAFCYVGLLA